MTLNDPAGPILLKVRFLDSTHNVQLLWTLELTVRFNYQQ